VFFSALTSVPTECDEREPKNIGEKILNLPRAFRNALARAGQKHWQFEVPRPSLDGVLREQRTVPA
jgi:hypothetical protein